jgi:hypothetical protein
LFWNLNSYKNFIIYLLKRLDLLGVWQTHERDLHGVLVNPILIEVKRDYIFLLSVVLWLVVARVTATYGFRRRRVARFPYTWVSAHVEQSGQELGVIEKFACWFEGLGLNLIHIDCLICFKSPDVSLTLYHIIIYMKCSGTFKKKATVIIIKIYLLCGYI